jgi:hypothetical protein
MAADFGVGISKPACDTGQYSSFLSHARQLENAELRLSFSYWREFLESMRDAFGKTWRENVITNIAVATKAPSERGAGASVLFDESRSLLDRLRNARRRARQVKWWQDQYRCATDSIDRGLWVLAAFSWAHPDSLAQLIKTFDRAVNELDDLAYASALEACELSALYAKYSRASVDLQGVALSDLRWRTIALLHDRLPISEQREAETAFLRSRSKDDLAGAVFLDRLSSRVLTARGDISEDVQLISHAIRRGIVSKRVYFSHERVQMKAFRENRRQIIKSSWEMPSSLVAAAHSVPDTRRRFPPVMEIAEKQKWFDV